MRKLSILFVVSLALAFSHAVQAQASEQISSFKHSVIVDETSAATITETISYDFGSNQRRGIFRELPIRYYQTDEQGFELSIEVLSVLRDGAVEPYALENNSADFLTIRIGDPSVYISGSHTYELVYQTSPLAVNSDDDHQIIRLDVPGIGWSVPTQTVTSDFTGPRGLESVACYEGAYAATNQSCLPLEASVNYDAGFGSSGPLEPGKTLTVEYVYPAGSFSQVAELARLSQATSDTAGMVVGATIAGLGALVGSYYAMTYWRHKKRKAQEVPYPRYEPPEGMTPAQIGLLVDNSSAGAELSATIINLAVQGHLKITLEKAKKWYRKAVYSFTMTAQAPPKLEQHEQDLFSAFFDGERAVVSTKDLIKDTKFQSANRKFHKDLKESLEQLGFYKKANFFRTLAGRMSDSGYSKWAEIEGFRRFLELTEADRMAMLEAPERTPEQFSAFLPYAVALGVEKQWTEQFESLNVDISSWYDSPGVGTYALASGISDLSSGLNQVAHSANSTSGTSGVSGGFSGGGFGGGGGGSW